MHKQAMIAGSLFAAIAVILGAFGAHKLKEVLTPELLQSFETGARYQMYHSMALLFAGFSYAHASTKMIKLATYFFIIGVILFSGSIYLLVMFKSGGQIGLGSLGLLTPIGGLFFIAGWVTLCIGYIKGNK